MKLTTKLNKKAFSIMEISMVLLCISIIVSITINYSVLMNEYKLLHTKTKLIKISKALENYTLEYNSLPCPSDIMLKKVDNNFGKEQIDSNGECKFGNGVIKHSSNIVLGGVPVKALNLSIDDAIDSWGNKIIYTVDNNLTKEYKNITTNLCVSYIGKTNHSKINNLYFALISTGENMYYAIPANSSSVIIKDNLNHDNEVTNIFSATKFLSNSLHCLNGMVINDKNFDDIVLFKKYNKLLELNINKEY